MKKLIIILIIMLTTFVGGNIYTNNKQRLSENVTTKSEDNTINFEENTMISESSNEDFGKLSENLEKENELELSNDRENEEITSENSNVTITLRNAEEEKREEKITKEDKRKEETKAPIVEETKEVSQPKEEPNVVETKPEPIKEPEPVTPKCNGSNHGVGVGNSNKWFNTQQEAINYFDGIQKTWGDKWERFEIDSETYDKNCPYGYEVWSCPFCGKWTINFYYR
ncbi:MAG: hypothetical protein IKG14_04395 [Clostridia bacterium]|nr:hypothetical protein [Clostridia bacterium]